jgi:hypothetical protein
MTTHPEIRINFSYLLHGVSKNLDKFFNPEDSKLAGPEQCEEWATAYRDEWAKHEEKILKALHEIVGLQFHKNVIDVSLVQYFIPQSDPLIIHFLNEPDLFVDVLAHELIHLLLTDNEVVQLNSHDNEKNLKKEWTKLFGERHDFKTLVHIPVHAILKSLYLDFLDEEYRYTRDVERASSLNKGASYVSSWEYVNENGYKEIIAKLRESYESLRKDS